MPKFTVTTLGCKVNQYESAAIRQTLLAAGLDDDGDGPFALCVVHTCCVTSTAGRKSRQLIRRLAAANPGAELVVTGCYATSHAAALRRISGVTAVVGHGDDVAAHLARVAARLLGKSLPDNDSPPALASTGGGDNNRTAGEHKAAPSISSIQPFSAPKVKGFRLPGTANLTPLQEFPERRRAIVKVQDGCDGFCSYCIIAHLRNRLYSRPLEEVLAEVAALVASGGREVVLCGVNLGAYGRETVHRRPGEEAADHLAKLLAAVTEVDGVLRLRLSSLAPGDISDELLAVMASKPRICKHLHLSLQSGSTEILTRMNRRYTADQFCRTLDRVRAALDRPAFTTDVIVGFPGETDADFDATLAVCRRAGFGKIHIFPYSPREGTAAAAWEAERPSGAVVKERLARLTALEAELAEAHRAEFVGQVVNVLLEEELGDGRAAGLTERYIRVFVSGVRADQLGMIVRVRVGESVDGALAGAAEPF